LGAPSRRPSSSSRNAVSSARIGCGGDDAASRLLGIAYSRNQTPIGDLAYSYDALNRLTSAQTAGTNWAAATVNGKSEYWGNSYGYDAWGNLLQKSITKCGAENLLVTADAHNWIHASGTDYQYDAFNNLTCVVQKGTDTTPFTSCASASATWRPRSFSYDSLSRLLSATNPESGTISYVYDANGNLATKTAPAPNQTGSATVATTYTYDALNRLTQTSYSDGAAPAPTPSAYFLYDLVNPWGSTYPNNSYIGRLDETITKNASGTWLSSSFFVHDPLGRVTTIGQCMAINCGATGFHTLYSYDLMGNRTSFRTTENNITFSYGYNTAGRPIAVASSLVDAQHPATLATVNSSVGYWAFGGLRMITLGNGLTETTAYNSRLQPCRMNVNSSGSWYNLCSAAVPTGSVQDFTYGFSLGSADNGNLSSMSAAGARTRTLIQRGPVHFFANKTGGAYTRGARIHASRIAGQCGIPAW